MIFLSHFVTYYSFAHREVKSFLPAQSSPALALALVTPRRASLLRC